MYNVYHTVYIQLGVVYKTAVGVTMNAKDSADVDAYVVQV